MSSVTQIRDVAIRDESFLVPRPSYPNLCPQGKWEGTSSNTFGRVRDMERGPTPSSGLRRWGGILDAHAFIRNREVGGILDTHTSNRVREVGWDPSIPHHQTPGLQHTRPHLHLLACIRRALSRSSESAHFHDVFICVCDGNESENRFLLHMWAVEHTNTASESDKCLTQPQSMC